MLELVISSWKIFRGRESRESRGFHVQNKDSHCTEVQDSEGIEGILELN